MIRWRGLYRNPGFPVLLVVPIIAGFLLLSSCAQNGGPGDLPLSALLPEPSHLEGWAVKDEGQSYGGDQLYLYMDGGAEIYKEYGFSQILAQDYEKGELSISLEIFKMTSPSAAYGIFSLKRSGRGKIIGIGSEDSLENNYLYLWRGKYFVTISGMQDDNETANGILALAMGITRRIREEAALPRLVAALPRQGLIDQSVKYFKGQLGLFNVYPSFTNNVLGVQEAVKGDYSPGYSVLVLLYGSPVEAAERFTALETASKDRLAGHDDSQEPSVLRVVGKGNRVFRARLEGRFILMIDGVVSSQDETRAFDDLIKSSKRSLS
jgi:hypothetical protein